MAIAFAACCSTVAAPSCSYRAAAVTRSQVAPCPIPQTHRRAVHCRAQGTSFDFTKFANKKYLDDAAKRYMEGAYAYLA